MVNRVNEWRGWQGKGMKERNIPVAHGPGAAPRVKLKQLFYITAKPSHTGSWTFTSQFCQNLNSLYEIAIAKRSNCTTGGFGPFP